MAQYRTVMGRNGEVRIQRKAFFLFFSWWEDMSMHVDADVRFKTEKEAEKKIREWQKNEKAAGKVLKKYDD